MGRIFWDKKMGTYTTNNNMYLVDLMFMYVNDRNLISKKINIKNLLPQIYNKGWDDVDGNPISAMDVIKNKNKKHYQRIKDADLRYPILR